MINFRFFLLFIPFISFCYPQAESKLEDHFKKVDPVSSSSAYKNIECIYLINLDARPEKWERSKAQFARYGIYPYRFSAVNGWEDLNVSDMQDIGLKYQKGMKQMEGSTFLTKQKQSTTELFKEGRGYFRPNMSWGMVGCLLSHLSILQDALDRSYEIIWVLEDDTVIAQDPRQIPDLISELDALVGKEGWDVLFTDRDFRNSKGHYERCIGWSRRPNFRPKDPSVFREPYLVSPKFKRIGARFGTHSMILKKSGIQKILGFVKTYMPFNPIDLDMNLPENIRLFSLVDDVITNEVSADSDTLTPINP